MNLLARNGARVKLNEAALTKLLQPVFAKLAERLTKMKLGQIVPIAGIVVGAGMNYAMLDRIGRVAHWAYRERFLSDKGHRFEDPSVSSETGDPARARAVDDGDVISVVQIAADNDLDGQNSDDGV